MALSGTLEVEVGIKSNPDEFWKRIRDSTEFFPKTFPLDYKSIQVLQGDGKSPGTVRLFTYGEGSPLVKVSKERIEKVDEEKKIYVYRVIDGDLMNYYKDFEGTISVSSEGDVTLAKWSGKFEKTSHEIPDPHAIKDFAVRNFQEIDAGIQKM